MLKFIAPEKKQKVVKPSNQEKKSNSGNEPSHANISREESVVGDKGEKIVSEPKSTSVCCNLTSESNARSLAEMKKSFQPKTRLQRSVMWKYVGILKPPVLIGNKFCELGCKIHFAEGQAVGAVSKNCSPGNF